MDTQMMVLMASAGAVVCIVSVFMALWAGTQYSDHLQRMPAATAFENIVERLKNKREELEQVEAECQKRNALKAELDGIVERRKVAEDRLNEIQQDIAKLDCRRAEIEEIRDELTEGRTQLAERRAQFNELVIAAERARAQIALFDELKPEIEALTTLEKDTRARLTEANGKLDYIDRQLALARVETESCAAEKENSLAEKLRLDEKKIQLQHELAELQKERDPLAKELEKNRQELQTAYQDLKTTRQQGQELEDELANLRFVRAGIEATTATTKNQLESMQIELEKLRQQREPLVAELAVFETACKARQVIEDELAGLQTQRITAEVTLNTVRMDLENIQNQLNKSQQDRDSFEDERKRAYQELESARRELTTVRGQSQEYQEELANLRALRANIEAAITTNREAVDTVQAELKKLQEKRDPLSAELENIHREIITERKRRQELEEEVNGLRATYAVLEDKVTKARENLARTQPGDNDPPAPEKIANLLSPPACLVEQRDNQEIPVLPHAQLEVSEAEALRKVLEHIRKLGLYFPERTLYAFHTALKTAAISPLTVLAGISGTGKSQLPRRYAEAMGIHFLKIPVQPRWDSPQDMLGFYNYLEGRYKATELARALVHFDPYHWPDRAGKYQDRLMLVLLDEMNLARVEYYFSEFLSQLEGRPEPGNINPDHIRNSTIILDIGSSESRRIYPGHNLLFVGTMNEDESTQTLSDKVLDRANLLRFSRPAKLMDKPLKDEAGCPATGYLSANVWHKWQRDTIDPSIGNSIGEWIKVLNDALDGLGRPFAHRVNQAILAYVANYPIISNKTECAQFAFSDLLAQRILPKLRGIELDDDDLKPYLKRIKDLISNKLNDQQLADAFDKAVNNRSGRPFVWTGVRRD